MDNQTIQKAIERVESFPTDLLRSMEGARPERTYEKGHVFPISVPERFGPADESIIDWKTVASIDDPLRLYVHIPWCKSRCTFCFYESNMGQPSKETVTQYLDSIEKELGLYAGKIGKDKIDTEVLYIGGGTPSILTPSQIDHLFKGIRRHVNFAPGAFLITESSPGTLTNEKVEAFQNNGINRMSIGIQTLDDEILRMCRRDHDAEQAKKAYETIRKFGMPEINIDLMLGLPNQTYESFQKTLTGVIGLSPSSISFLDLRICPGAALNHRADKVSIPSWKDDIVMRAIYQAMMKETSYNRTRPHYYVNPSEMKHRATRVPCLDSRIDLGFQIGVGVSAYSHLENVAIINTTGPSYVETISRGRLPIQRATFLRRADKTAMRAIRRIIDTTTVPNTEDVINQYKQQIEVLKKAGILTDNLELTDDGCLFGEEVVYSFYPSGEMTEDLANCEVGFWKGRHMKDRDAMIIHLSRMFILQNGLSHLDSKIAAELKVEATEHHDTAKRLEAAMREFPYLKEHHEEKMREEWELAKKLLQQSFDILYNLTLTVK